MKILMCDDSKAFLEQLQILLKQIFAEMNMDVLLILFTEPGKALSYIKEYKDIDIIFMDILMGKSNGYEVAKEISSLRVRSKIIFVSSTPNYALKGYDIGVTRYLLKPVKKNRLSHVLKDLMQELQYQKEAYIIEKNDSGIHKIFLDEVVYIETAGRNTVIHTVNEDIISYKNMKRHEERLNSNFVRCHTSYIVNMRFVRNYHGYEIHLLNNEEIWVGKSKRKAFLHSLTEFYGDQL